MFIGHFALALAAKRAVPRVSLGMLFMSAQLADLAWPFLVLAGLEQVRIVPGHTAFTPLEFVSYPWSHSLVTLAAGGIVLGGAYRGIAGGRRSFVALSALVVSHWVLDWISHAPDMPLVPGGARYGLSLWNSVPATVVVESLLYAGGIAWYYRATEPRGTRGVWPIRLLLATLALLYVANILSGPPPSTLAIVVAGIAGGVLLTAWAWWADRLREARR